ncbi:hypothetical protein [Geomonas ferrireducens]|uniref:hypothetical protein n=1 Tax=Geomonas ferrireducens TaxID=2570227 RepID=UPI0010A846BF|nr:hypothetical protein [Geomonas ferrireducens]
MTIPELLTAFTRVCPNGVSFDAMAVRLLRQKVPFEDWQVEDLKSAMFRSKSGLWFTCEMILDEESLSAFNGQAMAWLMEYGCFAVERLLEAFCSVFRNIATLEDCAALLGHMGFTIATGRKGGLFCCQPESSLEERLAAISEKIAGWLEEADGTLTVHEIETEMPHLSAEALESIRELFLPEVHEAEVGGVPCWRNADGVFLPEDFSSRLTTIVDTLVMLEERVSVANLEFALNLLYCVRFRTEYALTDNDTFMRICAKHYHGGKNAFPNTKRLRTNGDGGTMAGKRVRSPNTRFHSLGVPIGAKLFFTKDSRITCTVLDDSNQVEYGGKAWAISPLAMHLLGGVVVNGFAHFSYEGESLWERRLRLKWERLHDKDPGSEEFAAS